MDLNSPLNREDFFLIPPEYLHLEATYFSAMFPEIESDNYNPYTSRTFLTTPYLENIFVFFEKKWYC